MATINGTSPTKTHHTNLGNNRHLVEIIGRGYYLKTSTRHVDTIGIATKLIHADWVTAGMIEKRLIARGWTVSQSFNVAHQCQRINAYKAI